jgi:hypothetical protein
MSNLETRLVRYVVAPLVLTGINSIKLGVCYTVFPEQTVNCLHFFKDVHQLVPIIIATNPIQIKESYDFYVDKTYDWIKSR